jgi:alpha-L-rhamnosidase
VKEAGTLETSQIDVFVKRSGADQVFQEDRYTLKGSGGVEVYVPRFTYHGFQYVEVTGWAGKLGVENFRGEVMHTDVPSAGEFKCSNELVNKIWMASRWAYLSNLMSIPTDCPTREKNGWTGDAQLAAEMGIYNFKPAAVYTKWMNDVEDAQHPGGDLPGIIPTGGWGYGKGIGPAWDSVAFHIPWYLYQYYGDTRILAEHYGVMQRYIEYLSANREDGVINFGLGDWAPYEAQTPATITGTAYFYRDALILAEAAKLLGKNEDARKYRELAGEVRGAFNRKFFDAKSDSYLSGTQTALSCALYQGLVPAGHEKGVFANLVNSIHARKDHLDCGILGTKYVMNVLLDNGRADLAYAIATQTDLPSWGYWIKEKGATTLYESWKDVDSRNHIMFGDIGAWVFKALAGIREDGVGFASVVIRPEVVGDLTSASATYDSIRGKIVSSWRLDGGKIYLDVTVPANMRGTVYLPTSDPTEVKESGGEILMAEGVDSMGNEKGVAVYAVGSGTYHFVAPQR